jgi:hypothetical protein
MQLVVFLMGLRAFFDPFFILMGNFDAVILKGIDVRGMLRSFVVCSCMWFFCVKCGGELNL